LLCLLINKQNLLHLRQAVLSSLASFADCTETLLTYQEQVCEKGVQKEFWKEALRKARIFRRNPGKAPISPNYDSPEISVSCYPAPEQLAMFRCFHKSYVKNNCFLAKKHKRFFTIGTTHRQMWSLSLWHLTSSWQQSHSKIHEHIPKGFQIWLQQHVLEISFLEKRFHIYIFLLVIFSNNCPNSEEKKQWGSKTLREKKRHSFCFDLIYLHKHHHVWNRYIYFPETYEKRSLAFLFLQHFQFMQNKISIPHLSSERQFNFNSCRRDIFWCLHLQKVGSWRLLVLEDDSSCAWIEKFYFFLLERKR